MLSVANNTAIPVPKVYLLLGKISAYIYNVMERFRSQILS